MDFPKEMYDMFERIREQQDANLRMCTTLVAGFIATDERDVNYMDSFMDSLFDCMEQQNEEELLMRKYIDHIATFVLRKQKNVLSIWKIFLGTSLTSHVQLVILQKNYMQDRLIRAAKTISYRIYSLLVNQVTTGRKKLLDSYMMLRKIPLIPWKR